MRAPLSGRGTSLAAIVFALLLAAASRGGSQAPHRPGSPAPESRSAPSREEFVGNDACRSCHAKESASFEATGHSLTSRPADAQSIAGSFHEGANVLKTANPALYFRMTADGTGFHQTAVDEVSPTKSVELTRAIDLVIGSGNKAQTYLYWKEDQLFELPVSYWVKTGGWINSPGYMDGAMRFDRPVYPRCLECHGSSFASLAPPANRFAKSSLILGIECERCHGPGRAHVAYYRAHPATTTGDAAVPAQAIVNTARLARSRQMDACAICHAGVGKPLAPALRFQAGEALDRYLQIPPMDPSLPVDVHGNQVQLLERSRCFQKSAMTCTTCHNVHAVERDDAAFSKRCLGCHQAKQCGEFHARGEAILTRCVECHMPLRKSAMLFSESNDQTLQLPVRDHRIAIYPDTAK